MPPPAAATHTRQLPGTQFGSTWIAVSRPDSCVFGPVRVTGSKNCDASPETFGVTGPIGDQLPGAAATARLNAPPERKLERDERAWVRLKLRCTRRAMRSST